MLIFSSLPISVLGLDDSGDGFESGNSSTRGSRENIPPNVNITQPANEAKVSGVIIIKGHAWDVDGNITLVQVRINGTYYNATDNSGNNSWYNWSLNFNTTILMDSEYQVSALAKDNGSKLGDYGIWILIKNTPVPKENHWPYVNITQPKNEAKVSGVITIKGHAWDIDGNITLVQVIINGTYYNATDTSGNGSGYTWSLVFNTTILTDGEYRVVALSHDDGSKLGDYGIWIIVDNIPEPKENHWPYVNITQPKNEAKVSGMITIKGYAWDIDGNITLVQVRIADVYYNVTDTSGNGSWYSWSLLFNTTILNDDEYRVVAISHDDGGKLGDAHIWIIVDNIPDPKENRWPCIKITQPSNEARVSGVITIKGRAWDPDGNITFVKVRIAKVYYNATDTSGNGTWYTWELVFNTTKLGDGEYRVVALARDNGGKLGDAGIWIIVDNIIEPKKNQRPFVIITHPKNSAKVSGMVKIKGRAWDIDGKIVQVRVKIGKVYFNATDTSGNGSWYTWEFKWNTSGFENGSYRITAIAYDGKDYEDAHIEVTLKNPKKEKDKDKEKDKKPKKKPSNPIPGFEGPITLLAALIVVVVAFFRSRIERVGGRKI